MGPFPRGLVAGDFNGDGRLDLVVVNWGNPDLNFLAGNGDGTFATPLNYPAGTSNFALVQGDFNGDGKLDLVMANGSNNRVSMILGDGRGAFSRRQFCSVRAHPVALAVGDFNGDGKADLAVVNANGNNVSVLLNGTAVAFFEVKQTDDKNGCIAGTKVPFAVEARDAFRKPDLGFNSTIRFRSSDPRARLPADYLFAPGDKGKQGFLVTFPTPGIQRFLVADAQGRRGHCTVQVLGPKDIHLILGVPKTVTAGKPFTLTLSAQERFGDLVPFYPGTIRFTCTDPKALLPADFTFTPSEGSFRSLVNGVTLFQPGQWTITATDTTGRSLAGSVTVQAVAGSNK